MLWLGILIVVCGEAISIVAEIVTSRHAANGLSLRYAAQAFATITFGGGLLLLGYALGYRSSKNIWIIAVASITAILIVEPLVAYLVFREGPTRGALIGLGLGILGFIATLTIK